MFSDNIDMNRSPNYMNEARNITFACVMGSICGISIALLGFPIGIVVGTVVSIPVARVIRPANMYAIPITEVPNLK